MPSSLRNAFAALNRYDPAGIVAEWDAAGVYDNPLVGPPAAGLAAVNHAMTVLCDNARNAKLTFVLDRVTDGPSLTIAEWHVTPGTRRGIHVADLDPSTQKLKRVTVYPRD